jgi:hypothetical protein
MNKISKKRARELAKRSHKARAANKAARAQKGTSHRRKELEDDVWWVFGAEKDDDAGKGEAGARRRVLMEMKKKDPVAFLKGMVFQVLPAPAREQSLPRDRSKEEREEDVIGDAEEHLNRFLAELDKKENPMTGADQGTCDGSRAA